MLTLEQTEDLLNRYVTHIRPSVEQSEIFMQLWNRDMHEEARPLVQLALAVLLDKPIYILIEEDDVLPENMKALAKDFEYFKGRSSEEVNQAALRLMKRNGIGKHNEH